MGLAVLREIIWTIVYVYPHLIFTFEVNGNIMPAEAYQREDYSCWCCE